MKWQVDIKKEVLGSDYVVLRALHTNGDLTDYILTIPLEEIDPLSLDFERHDQSLSIEHRVKMKLLGKRNIMDICLELEEYIDVEAYGYIREEVENER